MTKVYCNPHIKTCLNSLALTSSYKSLMYYILTWGNILPILVFDPFSPVGIFHTTQSNTYLKACLILRRSYNICMYKSQFSWFDFQQLLDSVFLT